MYANDDELLQRELLGLLYQLSKTPEGARQLDMYGPTPVLADALHSRHKAICMLLEDLKFEGNLSHFPFLDLKLRGFRGFIT